MIEHNILARYARLVSRARSAFAFAARSARRARTATRSAAGDLPAAVKQRVGSANPSGDARLTNANRIRHEFRRTADERYARGVARRRARRAPLRPTARMRRFAEARTSHYLRELAATTKRR